MKFKLYFNSHAPQLIIIEISLFNIIGNHDNQEVKKYIYFTQKSFEHEKFDFRMILLYHTRTIYSLSQISSSYILSFMRCST